MYKIIAKADKKVRSKRSLKRIELSPSYEGVVCSASGLTETTSSKPKINFDNWSVAQKGPVFNPTSRGRGIPVSVVGS